LVEHFSQDTLSALPGHAYFWFDFGGDVFGTANWWKYYEVTGPPYGVFGTCTAYRNRCWCLVIAKRRSWKI